LRALRDERAAALQPVDPDLARVAWRELGALVAAKAVWILELHLVHHCPGFACFMPRLETLWGSV
jgi:hypothetical protein